MSIKLTIMAAGTLWRKAYSKIANKILKQKQVVFPSHTFGNDIAKPQALVTSNSLKVVSSTTSTALLCPVSLTFDSKVNASYNKERNDWY